MTIIHPCIQISEEISNQQDIRGIEVYGGRFAPLYPIGTYVRGILPHSVESVFLPHQNQIPLVQLEICN